MGWRVCPERAAGTGSRRGWLVRRAERAGWRCGGDAGSLRGGQGGADGLGVGVRAVEGGRAEDVRWRRREAGVVRRYACVELLPERETRSLRQGGGSEAASHWLKLSSCIRASSPGMNPYHGSDMTSLSDRI